MTTVGFIGLGHMGYPMVRSLMRAGFRLCVYDVIPASVSALEKEGAIPTDSISSLAVQSDVVITSVQTSQQVRAICMGEGGIFHCAKAHSLYIDCSSIDISMTRMLHEEAEKAGVAMIDAPVSGGVNAAVAATLTIMVGGREDHFQQAQPILKAMGQRVIYAGLAGNGQAAKICNNLLLAISMIGVCEAFSLAKKLGLDPKEFYEISSNASGQCWAMTSYCPVPDILENVPANHHYQPGFMAKMMLKDLRLGQHAAEMVQAAIPLGGAATELYQLYVNQGGGEMDFSGIIHLIESILVE